VRALEKLAVIIWRLLVHRDRGCSLIIRAIEEHKKRLP
jgi:hypothetical protein